MRHPPHWKIIAALMAMLAGVVLTASPGLSQDAQKKTVIVAELQSRELFKPLFERLAADLRAALREAGIGYKAIRPIQNGVRGEVSEGASADKVSEIIDGVVRGRDPAFALERADQKFTLTLSEPAMAKLIDQAVDLSLNVLQRRLNDLKLADASVERQDADRLLIRLPGSVDAEKAGKLIGQTGALTFQVACDEQPQGSTINPPEDCAAFAMRNLSDQKIWVKMTTAATVDGNDIIDANAQINEQINQPIVNFRFNQKGAEQFARLTAANIGQQVAIVLDRLVISAPRIVEPILGGSGQISGNFTSDDADSLVLVLRSGALPAPITFISMKTEDL